MDLNKALRLLKLNSQCTLEELNDSFRKLAKKHHPDSNRGREEWAHKTMTELNLAYEKVLDHVTMPSGGIREEKPPSTRERVRTQYQILFSRSIRQVLDGIYTYYQYGLENVRLRHEGTRKFRFRDSVRDIQDGLKKLEELQTLPKSDSAAVRLQIFTDFSLSAGANNGLTFAVPPVSPTAQTFARFRFNQAGGLSYDGPAADGEVEDYEVAVQEAPSLVVTTAADVVDALPMLVEALS